MAPVVCLRPQYSLTALAMLCLSLGKHGHVSEVGVRREVRWRLQRVRKREEGMRAQDMEVFSRPGPRRCTSFGRSFSGSRVQ